MIDKKDLTLLARVGALNEVAGITHRRDALWQMERAGKREGPLFRQKGEWLRGSSGTLPLHQMKVEERLVADYAGTDLTIDKHPIYYRRIELHRQGIDQQRSCETGGTENLYELRAVLLRGNDPARPKDLSSTQWKMRPVLRTSLFRRISMSETGWFSRAVSF
jgi:DNA polymerase III alpha subunit